MKLAFGKVADCEASLTDACTNGKPIPNTKGQNDAAGCLAAETASCDAFFEDQAHPPAACRTAPGTAANGGGCGYDAQCPAGQFCNLLLGTSMKPVCMLSLCDDLLTTGTSCTLDSDCDPRIGDRCVDAFPVPSPKNPTCQNVTYGGSGDDCDTGSVKDCQTGFNCVSKKCAPVLGANAVCDPVSNNNCDSRIYLSCLPVPMSSPLSYACTGLTVVPAGSQCGLVTGVVQLCEGGTICDTGSPTKCQPKVAKGGACTASPNNCVTGLECTAGICADPAAPTCP